MDKELRGLARWRLDRARDPISHGFTFLSLIDEST
jgi:hypothetical protein